MSRLMFWRAIDALDYAVVDALKPLGITHLDMPATPERVWRAITNAKAGIERDI